jgi:hypothetical protein
MRLSKKNIRRKQIGLDSHFDVFFFFFLFCLCAAQQNKRKKKFFKAFSDELSSARTATAVREGKKKYVSKHFSEIPFLSCHFF